MVSISNRAVALSGAWRGSGSRGTYRFEHPESVHRQSVYHQDHIATISRDASFTTGSVPVASDHPASRYLSQSSEQSIVIDVLPYNRVVIVFWYGEVDLLPRSVRRLDEPTRNNKPRTSTVIALGQQIIQVVEQPTNARMQFK